MRRPQSGGPPRRERASGHDRLAPGQRIRDRRMERTGTILDLACQYAHPKADPVYNYLVRWDDGQVEALAEAALDGTHGLDPMD